MPPTDFCKLRDFDVRARTRAPVPRWDDGHNHLPVLTRKRPLPCGSGSVRRVVLRSVMTTPLPVPPACAGLPDLDTAATAPPPNDFRRRCVVAINAHEFRGPSEGRVFSRIASGVFEFALASGACPLRGDKPTTFPSSASSGHPLSPVLAPTREETLLDDVDRPRLMFRRCPAKGTGFPQAGMPFTADVSSSVHRVSPARGAKTTSRSRRPTRFPQTGERCLEGPCKRHGAVTRDPWLRECEHLFYPLELLVPGN
jgi:hypothetical protein